MTRILCVAEKPAIAKAVANHLSGGRPTVHAVRGNQYVKNYEFDYTFPNSWGSCSVVMTSVLGHLTNCDFPPDYKSWSSCHPRDLFTLPIITAVDKDKQAIADNITRQARSARVLFIWTDCDREGEHIGAEIRECARKGKAGIEIARARFSNTERAHVLAAARSPVTLDERQVDAVTARIELDLRIGASLTRWQTGMVRDMRLQQVNERQIVSYGSCQFPTLGFVVDRYFRVRGFVPESFWYIELGLVRDGVNVKFNWDRNRLFDRMSAVILFERALEARVARITDLKTKPTSKWKPLPLTTVELQRLGALFLRMDSQKVMQVAEKLYNQGFISYPRTETDQFDAGIDLRALVAKQTQDRQWGQFAQGLLDGAFQQPRRGRNNDKAHPPIHPVNFVERSGFTDENERRVYEFVTRRFLACCSEDARGQQTTVTAQMGDEGFHANGLVVTERNYLDVYPYDRWESSQPLPQFAAGETFEPSEIMLRDGKTSAPGYLTEPELIQLMDANGIGTDATMAEHIAKIKEREYVITRPRGGGSGSGGSASSSTRGGRGAARSGPRSGSGSGSGSSSSGVLEFIPTTLGTALIKGYDELRLETTMTTTITTSNSASANPATNNSTAANAVASSSSGGGGGGRGGGGGMSSLGKPFLRREMEARMRDICAGTLARHRFVDETLDQYRAVFLRVESQVSVLQAAVRRYVVNGGADN